MPTLLPTPSLGTWQHQILHQIVQIYQLSIQRSVLVTISLLEDGWDEENGHSREILRRFVVRRHRGNGVGIIARGRTVSGRLTWMIRPVGPLRSVSNGH